jgi:hypothetical protein
MLLPPPRTGFFAIDGDDEGGDDADIVKFDFWGLQFTLMGFETRLQLHGRAGKELPKCARWVKGE